MALISDAGAAGRFEFAYDDPNFCDKILRLEVVASSSPSNPTLAVSRTSNPTLAVSRKRAREEDDTSDGCQSLSNKVKIQNVNDGRNRMIEESVVKTVATISIPSSGEREALEESESVLNSTKVQKQVITEQLSKESGNGLYVNGRSGNGDNAAILQVKEIIVSCILLASESIFFHKLFSNGMKESVEDVVSVQLFEEELEPFEEIIYFIYKSQFRKVDPKSLLSIAVTADKFQVTRAINHCKSLMLELQMTLEAAILYLEFSSENAAVTEALAPVQTASGEFLIHMFKSVHRHQEDLLQLPLSAIIKIFSSSELIVPFEDFIYTFLVKWASQKYPDQNQRSSVFRQALVFLIRFMHMSIDCLLEFGRCSLMPNKAEVMTIVSNAMLYKVSCSSRRIHHWNYEQRQYLIRPIKFTNLMPYPEALAYMDVSLDDCSRMSNPGSTNTYSEIFTFGGYRLFMQASCILDAASNAPNAFGLFLCAQRSSQPEVNLTVTFSVRQKPTCDYVDRITFNSPFATGNKFGVLDLFLTQWAQLLNENSIYVIDGRLYLRVHVSIRQP